MAEYLRKGGINKNTKSLLKEDKAPGFVDRNQGEALPTYESVKAAYEAKNKVKEEYNSGTEEYDDDADYDTGGYVEAMGRDLDEHVNAIVSLFKEWKAGPMTEPGMEGYAKDDLISHIQRKIRNA